MSGDYARLSLDQRDHHSPASPSHPPGAIRLNSLEPVSRPSTSSDGDSDIIYRDTLDDEPFEKYNEKTSSRPFEDDGHAEEDGEGYEIEPRRLRPRKKSRRVLAVLIGIVGFAAVIGTLSALGWSAPAYNVRAGNKHMTMDHVFNGTFAVRTKQIDWVKEGKSGHEWLRDS